MANRSPARMVLHNLDRALYDQLMLHFSVSSVEAVPIEMFGRQWFAADGSWSGLQRNGTISIVEIVHHDE